MFRPSAAVAAALAAASCTSSSVTVGALPEVANLKAIPNRDLDILFVIDNSASMLDQQQALAAAFPRMMAKLAELDGGLPNLHIGVVTPDLGTSALAGDPAPAVGGCEGVGEDGVLRGSPQIADAFISDVAAPDGSRLTNYSGTLAEAFQSIAIVGTDGCGFEQQLAAASRAITNPVNAGFIRPEANLAIVVISDEDDCSAAAPTLFGSDPALGPLTSFRCVREGVTCNETLDETGAKTGCVARVDSAHVADVTTFVDAILAAKPDPRMLLAAGIAGDTQPFGVTRVDAPANALEVAASCTFTGPSGPETAFPAVRIASFLDAFEGRSERTSICDIDLALPLDRIGASAKRLLGDPCLDDAQLFDSSDEPGLQPACEVVDVRDSNPSATSPLPACDDATTTNCFELVTDPVACPGTTEHLRVAFRRDAPDADLWASVRCQLAR